MHETSSEFSVALPPDGEVHDRLRELILQEAPREAVGFLTVDGRILQLTNHSSHPENHFEVHREEMLRLLAREEDIKGLVFWHSHPGGGIGPSRTDLYQKMPMLIHLVASIVDDDLVYSFY